jgi:hypothetical protein
VTPQRASQLGKTVFASQTLAQSFTQLVDSFIGLKQRYFLMPFYLFTYLLIYQYINLLFIN